MPPRRHRVKRPAARARGGGEAIPARSARAPPPRRAGAAGNGLMTGGAGADTFQVGSMGAGEVLTITDYRPLEGDTLQWTGNASLVEYRPNADGSGYTLVFAVDASPLG